MRSNQQLCLPLLETELCRSSTTCGTPLPRFPSTRYQGSKRKVTKALAEAFHTLEFGSALDLYAGTGTVSLLLRHIGKRVDANDYQSFNQATARLLLTLDGMTLDSIDFEAKMRALVSERPARFRTYVQDDYSGIFFTDSENVEIDRFAQNVAAYTGLERDLYIYAVGQALMKKRPYNLFHRANLNMRSRQVKRSFGNAATWETSILDHAITAIEELATFPFDTPTAPAKVFGVNTVNLSSLPNNYDLVYLDPPYLNKHAVGVDYSNFYGFLEGLCEYELFSTGDARYPHKPINKKCSNWHSPNTALAELEDIVNKWSSSIIVLSYRSDGLPSPDQVTDSLSIGGRTVEHHSLGEYKYALSTTNTNEELMLISRP